MNHALARIKEYQKERKVIVNFNNKRMDESVLLRLQEMGYKSEWNNNMYAYQITW